MLKTIYHVGRPNLTATVVCMNYDEASSRGIGQASKRGIRKSTRDSQGSKPASYGKTKKKNEKNGRRLLARANALGPWIPQAAAPTSVEAPPRWVPCRPSLSVPQIPQAAARSSGEAEVPSECPAGLLYPLQRLQVVELSGQWRDGPH